MTTNTYDVKLREGSFTVECEHLTTTGGDYEFFNGWGRESETIATVPRENVLSVVRQVDQEDAVAPIVEADPSTLNFEHLTRVGHRDALSHGPHHRTRADGLCTQCWHATLWHIPVYSVTDTGVAPLANMDRLHRMQSNEQTATTPMNEST